MSKPMDEILDVKRRKGGQGKVELVKLSSLWAPNKYQVAHYVDDGAGYQSPGREICTGWSNHADRESAQRCFEDS